MTLHSLIPSPAIVLLRRAILSFLLVFALAYARCAISLWTPASAERAARSVAGIGPIHESTGLAWAWDARASFGDQFCTSIIIDRAECNAALRRAGTLMQRRGTPPSWSIAAQLPFPHDLLPNASEQARPAVCDRAFGLPFPCLALRTSSFHESRQPPSLDAMTLDDTPASSALPAYAQASFHDVRLEYGARFSSPLAGSADPSGRAPSLWPTRVLWTPFAANALLIFTLLSLPGLLRRVLRR